MVLIEGPELGLGFGSSFLTIFADIKDVIISLV